MNTSLKEYYVNLQTLYNNAVNMLTAINQSLSTNSPEISITVTDVDDASTTIRIPSFLYLENKIEQLSNNISNIIHMPSSGEAWFSNENDMYKLNIVRSNIAPVKPDINFDKLTAGTKDTNILKDIVNPNMFIKIQLNNVPDNIEKVFVKKLVIFNSNIFSELVKRKDSLNSYQDYVSALSNLTYKVDYDEYDFTIDMPLKREKYDSEFKILDIPELDSGNPYYESSNFSNTEQYNVSHLKYVVRLDTLLYNDHDDPSIEHQLKVGDKLTINDGFAIYKIKNISRYKDSLTESLVTLEEIAGHITLQTYSANESMSLSIYDHDYSEYKYVNVPLEENPYIVLFLGTIDSNTRSSLSKPILIDLNTIYMYNEDGTLMKDPKDGKSISYIDYYDKYCTNIGDIIQGISEVIYPQFSNMNATQLNMLENDELLKSAVTSSINKENIEVTCINTHLLDNSLSDTITKLYSEKNQYNTSLIDIQTNIDNTYNLLTSTDFRTDLSVTQESLTAKLNNYYAERTQINKKYIDTIQKIATLKAENNITEKSKYRIRGLFDYSIVDEYVKSNISEKCELIGIDVEYKYVPISSNQSNVTQINNGMFTNWNKYKSIDKERTLKFNKDNTYTIEYVENNIFDNTIKWNQVDIPITSGEDVIIRIRYKYNIGQPFMNLYSPWSDNVTFVLPEKYLNSSEIVDILADNDNDVISAKLMNTLINNGYEQHITNKLIDESQVFYHMPENIYSGFNTPENKLISLKDKLISMSNTIDKYIDIVETKINKEKYKVYIEYDNNVVELHNNIDNIINFNESNNMYSTYFTKKYMNIIIKNVGESTVNLYSIFNGNTSTSLLNSIDNYVNNSIEHYQRVPILISGTNNINDVKSQTLGQWIYFRQNNPYTLKDVYFNTFSQQESDSLVMLKNTKITQEDKYNRYQFIGNISDYLNKDNMQVLLPFKTKANIGYNIAYNGILGALRQTLYTGKIEQSENSYNVELQNAINSENNFDGIINWSTRDQFDKYYIKNQTDNKYIMKYEHICAIGSNNEKVYLAETTDISSFISKYNPKTNILSANSLEGMLLYPEIPSSTYLLCENNELSKQYKSIPTGGMISIPIILEYFLPNANSISISKTLCFDLKPSIDKDLDHYILKFCVNKNQLIKDDIEYSVNVSGSDSLE